MTNITQDMRYRLSLIKNTLKNMVLRKLPFVTKPTANTYIAGNADMTAQSSPYAAVPVAHIIIRISIHRKK